MNGPQNLRVHPPGPAFPSAPGGGRYIWSNSVSCPVFRRGHAAKPKPILQSRFFPSKSKSYICASSQLQLPTAT